MWIKIFSHQELSGAGTASHLILLYDRRGVRSVPGNRHRLHSQRPNTASAASPVTAQRSSYVAGENVAAERRERERERRGRERKRDCSIAGDRRQQRSRAVQVRGEKKPEEEEEEEEEAQYLECVWEIEREREKERECGTLGKKSRIYSQSINNTSIPSTECRGLL